MNIIKKMICAILSLCLLILCLLLSGCQIVDSFLPKDEQGSGSGEKVPSDFCEHQLEKLPWSVPSCKTEGKKGAFKCNLCEKIFAYSSELNALVEIEEQESIAKIDHSIGSEYAIQLKAGVTKADSFEDYEIVSSCDVCGTGFAVDSSNLVAFTPSTKLLYDDVTPVDAKREMVDGLVSTTYTFPSSTKTEVHNWVYHNNDSGELGANTKVPFTANSDRYLMLFVKNNSDIPVTFKYGAEYWSTYCWSAPVTVEADSYAAFVVKINFNGSDYASYHTIQLLSDISKDVSLTFGGYYVM